MTRSILLIIAVLLGLTACTLEPEKQWYKPGVDYTVAEFQRDQAACTKNRLLDEECMKQRGWVGLSGDRPPAAQDVRPAERRTPGK